jgi:hypothetical protein
MGFSFCAVSPGRMAILALFCMKVHAYLNGFFDSTFCPKATPAVLFNTADRP